MALEGTLQDMSLSDLIQIFRMGPKSGVLLMIHEPDRGLIYVSNGILVDAIIVRGAERTLICGQDEAILQMMVWEEASFVFRHDISTSSRPVRITHDSEWLILEGMKRREDPMRAIPYHSLSIDTKLQLSPIPSSAESGVSLDVHQWRILSQVAICKDVRTICTTTGIEPDKALRTIAELLSVGLIEIAAQPLPTHQANTQQRSTNMQSRPQNGSSNPTALLDHNQSGGGGMPQVGNHLVEAIIKRIRGL